MDEQENPHEPSSDDPVEAGSLDHDPNAAEDEQPALDVEGASPMR